VRLSFGLPRENTHSDGASWPLPADEKRGVDVSVYNVEGRVIRRLLSDVVAPGYYQVTWDGDTEAGVPASSGIYFLAVSVQGNMTSRKVVLVR
jgi:flagellar hook assembly protein FlgD